MGLAEPTTKKEPASLVQRPVPPFNWHKNTDYMSNQLCGVLNLGLVRWPILKESDVVIYQDHLEIFVESSKIDQFRDGAWVVIARSNTDLYPVAMLSRYMHMAAITRPQAVEAKLSLI